MDALFDSWDPDGSRMLELTKLESRLRGGSEPKRGELRPTPPGGKKRTLPTFMAPRDTGQLANSSSLPMLPPAPERPAYPRSDPPTPVGRLPSVSNRSTFDATAIYETTLDAHKLHSRQLYERTREAVQEAAAAANASQMATAAAAAAGGAGAAAGAARAAAEESRRERALSKIEYVTE